MRKFDNLYKAKHIYHITMPLPTENNDTSDDESCNESLTESFKAMLEEEQDEKRHEINQLAGEKMSELLDVIHLDYSSDDKDDCKMLDLWEKFCYDVSDYVLNKKFDDE